MKNFKKSLLGSAVLGVLFLLVLFSGLFDRNKVNVPVALATKTCSGTAYLSTYTSVNYRSTVNLMGVPSSMEPGANPKIAVGWTKSTTCSGPDCSKWEAADNTRGGNNTDYISFSGMGVSDYATSLFTNNNSSVLGYSATATITETTPGNYVLSGNITSNYEWQNIVSGESKTGSLGCSDTASVTVNASPVPTGTLSADPNPCTIASGATNCSSTVGWTFNNTPRVLVTVQAEGSQNEQNVTSAEGTTANGSATPTYIQNKNYTFRLYDFANSIKGGLLDSIVVSGVNEPALSVSLSANPISITTGGSSTLTANVTSNQTGTMNYTFYCNRSDTGTDVTSPSDGKYDGVPSTDKTKTNSCTYNSAGTKTAKVIVEQGGLSREARVNITVTDPILTPTGTLTADPNPCIIAEGTTACKSKVTWESQNTPDGVDIKLNGANWQMNQPSNGSAETGVYIKETGVTYILYDKTTGNQLATLTIYGAKGTIDPIPDSSVCQVGTGTPTITSKTVSWSTSPAYSGAVVKYSLAGGAETTVGSGASSTGVAINNLSSGTYTVKMYGGTTVMDTETFTVSSQDCTPTAIGGIDLSPISVVKSYPNISLNADFLVKNTEDNGSNIAYSGTLIGPLAHGTIQVGLKENNFIGSVFKSFTKIAEAYFNVLTGDASSGSGVTFSSPKTANLTGTTSEQELVGKGFTTGSNSDKKTTYTVTCDSGKCDSPTSASAEITYLANAPICTLNANWRTTDTAKAETIDPPSANSSSSTTINVPPGTPVTFSWDWGNPRINAVNAFNGSTVTKSQTKTITPPTDSSNTYTLNAQGPLNSTASCSIKVNVSDALACSPATQTVDTNTAVDFSASGGTGPYAWSIGGAGILIDEGPTFSTSFSEPGVKEVKLYDSFSDVSVCEVTAVTPITPVSCSAVKSEVYVGETASFTAKDGDGTYAWTAPGLVLVLEDGPIFNPVYSTTGTKTVAVSSDGKSASCSVNIIEKPDMYVTLEADPLIVVAGSSPGVSTQSLLTATVGGNVTGKINYTFYCDRSDDGTNITEPWYEQFPNTNKNPQEQNCFSYPVFVDKDTTFTAKVIAERGGHVDEDRINIIVKPEPTLEVDLVVAPNPVVVNQDTTLEATVGGTSTGTINYTFYCDRSAGGTNIAGNYDGKYDGVNNNPKSHNCNYATAGTYTAKVIAERGGLSREKRVPVTVVNAVTPTPEPNNPPVIDITSVTSLDNCGPAGQFTIAWDYSDPDGDPQSKYEIQIEEQGSNFEPPYVFEKTVSCVGCREITSDSLPMDNTTYKAQMRVWDSKGATSEWDISKTFSTPKHGYPQVDFTYSPTEPTINENVEFTDNTVCLGTGVPCRGFDWIFGDGGTSAIQNPTHAYSGEQTYSAKLTVTDKDNYSCSVTKDINVIEKSPDFKEVAP